MERLVQVVESALAHALYGRAHGPVAGGHDHFYFRVQLFYFPESGDAVHAGHHYIHHRQVEFFQAELLYRVGAADRAGNFVALPAEGHHHQLQDRILVVY